MSKQIKHYALEQNDKILIPTQKLFKRKRSEISLDGWVEIFGNGKWKAVRDGC